MYFEIELMGIVCECVEDEVINVFVCNLYDLLMVVFVGLCVIMGFDLGLCIGVKVVVVDVIGKLVVIDIIYFYIGQVVKVVVVVVVLCEKYNVELVVIGNGIVLCEIECFFFDVQKQFLKVIVQKVIVSEVGVFVYFVFELVVQEFLDFDVLLCGVVFIVCCLQDFLVELVKIDLKFIGVGQYQYDVSQIQLVCKLDVVVEDCVNVVGVDLNIVFVLLLICVVGLICMMVQNIVVWCDENGQFQNCQQLLKVSCLGLKVFEQCVGFLCINYGDNLLDVFIVYLEVYLVVECILVVIQQVLKDLMGNSSVLCYLKVVDFIDEKFGVLMVIDIIKELEKLGCDLCLEFKIVKFVDGVEIMNDLLLGMILEGVVINVINFGVFVDIGVYQDGLVYILLFFDWFVEDLYIVVKVGDIVKVKVMEVDLLCKCIVLIMCFDEQLGDSYVCCGGGQECLQGNCLVVKVVKFCGCEVQFVGNSVMMDVFVVVMGKKC